MFIPTPEECEVLGGLLLQSLQYWHEHPVTAAMAWRYLVQLLIRHECLSALDPYQEKECEREEPLCSGVSSPPFARRVREQDFNTLPASDEAWLNFCWEHAIPTAEL